ncbi:DUF262 domain-containing HNH endonuclease family protein [Gordonia McavH-238-E]|uniref:DUF262 domain-containing protein n=1 Tax=Gordonia sp. McavH-238-E TaxID=2917736 RepID=UPI001EF6BD20|nr:DUF262 domain-containing protein [Gordonia sp. McavH-238-E]MCG7635253.1 DUF262 domain-containing HNH endonuclease family protein [Gordonia sp. McavH-238-E]
MAEATLFDHDKIGHILADNLLIVPRFQRSFAWDSANVREYLSDLAQARRAGSDYFIGTVVFADSGDGEGRKQIVDGQQRFATTAILLAAIRDKLFEFDKGRQAQEIHDRYLKGYILHADDILERLVLSSSDQPAYDLILDGDLSNLDPNESLAIAYETCRQHLDEIAPEPDDYMRLIEFSSQLESDVQVLVAVASDLPEAYVIFETLNDRGADLTTADLLKNYLFSSAKSYFNMIESSWSILESGFDSPDDLVKFIRYEFVSRNGPVATRRLYRAIQAELSGRATEVRRYVTRLLHAKEIYLAVREPESSFWTSINVDASDALLAYRRFGFEASIPVLLAAFQKWPTRKAAKLLIKMAAWSIRAQVSGLLGGSVPEEALGSAAMGISDGSLRNQTEVRQTLQRIIPEDELFKKSFVTYGDVQTGRAKYLLAMLEKTHLEKKGIESAPIEWNSRKVTVEHIGSQSDKSSPIATRTNHIGNLALLEKRLNARAGSRSFDEKKQVYRESSFELTRAIARRRAWTVDRIDRRTRELADLAVLAWPGV